MHATRAAVKKDRAGPAASPCCVPPALKGLRHQERRQKTGVDIVRKAAVLSGRQIAINAGEDRSVIVGKNLEKDSTPTASTRKTGEYVNLISKGIIDRPRWFA